MTGFSFILTERCNWDCEYCAFPLIEKPTDTTIEILGKHLPYITEVMNQISPNLWIEAQGGELGLLPAETIAYFLQNIDSPVSISTNGLFLDKLYHTRPDIRPYIKDIILHMDQSPGDFSIGNTLDDDIPIIRGIVHNNIQDIVDFIDNNPHILFDYIELEYDIRKDRTTNIDDYRRLWTALKDKDNVSSKAITRVKKRIFEDIDTKNNCRKFHQCVTLDMINETICLCQRTPQHSIPLNRENLIKRLTTFPHDLFGLQDDCNSCTRLYFDKSPSDISPTLIFRRKLK